MEKLTRKEVEILRLIVHDHWSSECHAGEDTNGAKTAKVILDKIDRSMLPQGPKALTAVDLSDALGCFWNAALSEAQSQQEGHAVASILATGIDAVRARLQEIAGQ